MGILRNFIDDNRFKSDDVSDFITTLFFEGAKRRISLEQYAALLFLAAAIATYGVIGDSVATVIGAMIIAPLMRPIMATAAGMVMGDMKRAGRSLWLVFFSVVGVIGLSWLLTEVSVVKVIYFETNSQIAGRVSPRTFDLWAALWSGAAGAFAMSRKDVVDSLPGAAIAIALVPPLCVVGIGLSEGQWSAAGGAMLLFLTNFISIILAGSLVLALLGLHKSTIVRLGGSTRRSAFLIVAIVIILLFIPLGTTSLTIYQQRQIERETIQLAYHWLKDSDYEIRRVDAADDQVVLMIHGSGERPALSELGDQMNASLDQPIKLQLVVVPSEQEEYVPMLD